MEKCNHNNLQEIYSHKENARMMTIPEARKILEGSICYGSFNGPDTTLYNKGDHWYQVIVPCLACLGVSEYDDITPVVEIVEIDLESLLEN